MKIKIKKKSRSLIKLHVLKYQIYKNYKKYFFKANVENISTNLKQALKLIYLYNLKNKKILFIGFPYNKFLQNQLNHFFISKSFYTKNLLTGNINTLFNTKIFYKKPDLIVFNNTSVKDINILNVLKKLDIPLILFGDSNKLNINTYQVQGSLKKNRVKKFYFFLIFLILRRNIKLF